VGQAQKIVDMNSAGEEETINLKGFMVGNPYTVSYRGGA
jgi:hypothetical protein